MYTLQLERDIGRKRTELEELNQMRADVGTLHAHLHHKADEYLQYWLVEWHFCSLLIRLIYFCS